MARTSPWLSLYLAGRWLRDSIRPNSLFCFSQKGDEDPQMGKLFADCGCDSLFAFKEWFGEVGSTRVADDLRKYFRIPRLVGQGGIP